MTNVLHTQATVNCPHGGRATLVPADPRVSVSGQVAANAAGQWTIVGCPFVNPSSDPSPCVTIRWTSTATRVVIGTTPAVTRASQGICQSALQVPQGPPVITVVQPRAKGL